MLLRLHTLGGLPCARIALQFLLRLGSPAVSWLARRRRSRAALASISLASVVPWRTFLNYFLERDLAEVCERQGADVPMQVPTGARE